MNPLDIEPSLGTRIFADFGCVSGVKLDRQKVRLISAVTSPDPLLGPAALLSPGRPALGLALGEGAVR